MACLGSDKVRNNAPGLHSYDFFSRFLNLWHTGPRISVPCIPCTLPFSGRQQSLPRADTHLPAERSAWAAPLRPGPGSKAHRLKRTLGPRRANFSFRAESREPRTLSGAPRATKKRERILAFVGVCGRGMRKDPGCSQPALSAPPELRASKSLSPTPDKVGVCRLAGPSHSSSEPLSSVPACVPP